MNNLILSTDSYKTSQWNQYPPGTEYVSSYIEARGGMEDSVFFGLQMFLKKYLSRPITEQDINEAEEIITAHGLPFYREGWIKVLEKYNGFLPLRIEAVPEGTYMPTRNVQIQVTNTDPEFWWLTSYMETALLRAVWYPSTVATISHKAKQYIGTALDLTSDVPVKDQLPFKLHDFGARGVSSMESGEIGGVAHLVNFMGTDTMEALVAARKFYGCDMAGFSIPASEHSTMTSWGKENESKAYNNMLELFSGDGKLLACVSDSYDIFNATRNIWGEELADRVRNSGGTLVVRPDSGNPTQIPIKVIEILMEKFGFTTNSKGYKVLPEFVRVIQGDGINIDSIPKILLAMDNAKLSMDNLAFGMGGGLLQQVDRDVLKYAMKCSAIYVDGEWRDVYKDPVHGGKTSKKGRLGLVHEAGLGSPLTYRTVPKSVADYKGNSLITVWENGKLLVDDSLDDIRKRADIEFGEKQREMVSMYDDL